MTWAAALIFKGGKYEVIGGFISLTHEKYGKATLAPTHHRVNMTALAVEDSDWLSLDTWECTQDE
jgi:nicotinic acid mononucleotide adenylyltransferase